MKKKSMNKLSTYFFRHWPLVLAIIITGLLFDGLMGFISTTQGNLIDLFNNNADYNIILSSTLLFISLILFVQLNRFLKRLTVRKFANKMIFDMRLKALNNIMYQDSESLSKEEKGTLLNKSIGDISDTCEGVRKITTEIFDSFVLLISYYVVMFMIDFNLTLIVFIFMLLSILVSFFLRKHVYRLVKAYKNDVDEAKRINLNLIENHLPYNSIGAEEIYGASYIDKINKIEKSGVKALTLQNASQPFYKLIMLLSLFFIVVFGGMKVYSGVLSIGSFSALIATILLSSRKVSRLGAIVNAFQKVKVSWERCKPYLVDNNELKELNLQASTGLVLNNARFGFNDDCILNISYKFKNGLYGLSGKVHSGKSTFLSLCSGLYSYEGSIKLDSFEIKDFKDYSIPNLIGFAMQRHQLFNDSPIKNITLSREGDYDKVIKECEFSEVINNYHDNPISKNLLSGGEKGRLAIARALFNSPRLILIDDCFSGLDIDMSERIIANIKKNYQNSIIIISTNQSELIKLCTTRLVLEGGELHEC